MATAVSGGLGSLVVFQDCSVDELRRVAMLSRRRVVDPGTVLIEAGSPVTALSMLISGAVRIDSRDGAGGILGPGDLIGEISLLTGEGATADAVAHERTELLTIDAAHVPTLLAIPAIGRRLRAISEARVGTDLFVTAASVPVMVKPPRFNGRGAGLRKSRSSPIRSVVLSVIALAVAAGAVWFISERNKATIVGADDLLAQVRADPSAAPATPTAPAPATPTSPAADPSAPDPSSGSSAGDPNAPPSEPVATSEATGEASSPGSPTQPVAPPAPTQPSTAASNYAPPAPGVYTYATTGYERISIAGARHEYPEETHALVRHLGGCDWFFEHHVLEEHIDRQQKCSGAVDVTTSMFGTDIEFFGQRDGLEYYCNPPARTLYPSAPGTTNSGSCATRDGDAHITYDGVYVGPATMTVGATTVDTAQIHIEFTMTGKSRGTSSLDQWLDVRTGLVVRMEREVDTLAAGVWGDVRYEEEATFHLVSAEPRT